MPKDLAVQFIDVRDLASWVLAATVAGTSGTFNVTGPPDRYTLEDTLTTIQRLVGPAAHLTWVSEAFLSSEGVAPYTEMPLWIPPSTLPEYRGFMRRDSSKAQRHGLTTRDIEETIAATHSWLSTVLSDDARYPTAGMSAERERKLLTAWHQR